MFKCLTDFNLIVNFVKIHPYLSYGLIFATSFLESLAIIGAIAPGAVLMSVIGFLIGSGILPAKMVYLVLTAGVLCGDLLSFSLGIIFKDKIYKVWPFRRYPGFLKNGIDFFNKHGGKSICIGRFIGPMRAVIPMIAGILQMPSVRFIYFTLPSAIVWAIVYTIPGYLLGALALELPKTLVVKFIGMGLLILLILWFFIWVIQFCIFWLFRRIKIGMDCIIKKIEHFYPFNRLFDYYDDDKSKLLILLISIIFLFCCFIGLIYLVFNNKLFLLNKMLASLMANSRTAYFDKLMIAVTVLGNLSFLLVFSGLVLLGLLYVQLWRESIFWICTVSIAILVTVFFKFVYFLPRPLMVAYGIASSSFPSAHVTLSAVIYGFLAIININFTKKRHSALFLGVIVLLISISRLYLGVHWLSDILGGWLLASLILLVVNLIYKSNLFNGINNKINRFKRYNKLLWFLGIILWMFNLIINYSSLSKQYALIWPKQILSFSHLINAENPFLSEQLQNKIPLYRENRLGFYKDIFNLIYIGRLDFLQDLLIHKGWNVQDYQSVLRRTLKLYVDSDFNHHFSPLLPLYHGRKPALILTKADKENRSGLLILKLWQSDIDFIDLDSSVWIGSVEYHTSLPEFFSWKRFKYFRKKSIIFNGGGKALIEDLVSIFQIVHLPVIESGEDKIQILDHFWIIKEQ